MGRKERKGTPPKRLTPYAVMILGVCREAIRSRYERDFDDLPQSWKVKIETAVIDAELGGTEETMRFAAIAEYRDLASREKWAKSTEDDE